MLIFLKFDIMKSRHWRENPPNYTVPGRLNRGVDLQLGRKNFASLVVKISLGLQIAAESAR